MRSFFYRHPDASLIWRNLVLLLPFPEQYKAAAAINDLVVFHFDPGGWVYFVRADPERNNIVGAIAKHPNRSRSPM